MCGTTGWVSSPVDEHKREALRLANDLGKVCGWSHAGIVHAAEAFEKYLRGKSGD